MQDTPPLCPQCGTRLTPAEGDLFRCPQCGTTLRASKKSGEAVGKSNRYDRDVARARRDKSRFERDKERTITDRERIKAESKAKKIENERAKESESNRTLLICFAILAVCALIPFFMFCLPRIGATIAGDIAVPASSGELVGVAYTDVERRFADSGFTNVKCVGMEDLNFFTNIVHGDGSVDHVTINGDVDYSAEAFYPPDSMVRIYYHSFPGDVGTEDPGRSYPA